MTEYNNIINAFDEQYNVAEMLKKLHCFETKIGLYYKYNNETYEAIAYVHKYTYDGNYENPNKQLVICFKHSVEFDFNKESPPITLSTKLNLLPIILSVSSKTINIWFEDKHDICPLLLKFEDD